EEQGKEGARYGREGHDDDRQRVAAVGHDSRHLLESDQPSGPPRLFLLDPAGSFLRRYRPGSDRTKPCIVRSFSIQLVPADAEDRGSSPTAGVSISFSQLKRLCEESSTAEAYLVAK